MRYFFIEKDQLYTTSPIISGWRNQFNKVDNILDRSVFHIKSNSETVFTDIISIPFLLFSHEAFKIINRYERMLRSKKIALIDVENNFTRIYHLPINIDTARDKAIFYLDDIENKKLVINLELAESILRRNLIGFDLKEMK